MVVSTGRTCCSNCSTQHSEVRKLGCGVPYLNTFLSGHLFLKGTSMKETFILVSHWIDYCKAQRRHASRRAPRLIMFGDR